MSEPPLLWASITLVIITAKKTARMVQKAKGCLYLSLCIQLSVSRLGKPGGRSDIAFSSHHRRSISGCRPVCTINLLAPAAGRQFVMTGEVRQAPMDSGCPLRAQQLMPSR
jgi:hypothetical protein